MSTSNPFDPNVLGPQIRGLALKTGSGALVRFEADVASNDPLTDGFRLDLSEYSEVAGEKQSAAIAEALEKAWMAFEKKARSLPRIVEINGLGGFCLTWTPWAADSDRNGVVRNRVVVVTGGAQGFGEEISRGLAARGAFVAIADLNLAGAEKLADELNSQVAKPTAMAVAVDVGNEASVEAMIASVVREVGGIDLFVSNAGVLKAASVLEQDSKAFEFVTQVNYTGYFLCVKHAARVMKEQTRLCPQRPLDIVQINSKSGLEGSNKNGSYAGSKFGAIGLTQSFALELIAHQIKVNSICPGNFFDGPLWSDPTNGLFSQYLRTGKVPGAKTVADVKAFYEAKVPLGRGCTGPDVLKAILYIVEQVYETGQAVPVTGGQVMLN